MQCQLSLIFRVSFDGYLTCSAPTRLSGRPFITACVKRVITNLPHVSHYIPDKRDNKGGSYPTALSEKFRMYFFASILSRTTSATCLILPTRSTTYADRPDTLSRSFQGVFKMAANAGSQDISNSRKSVAMHVDMTLTIYQHRYHHARFA